MLTSINLEDVSVLTECTEKFGTPKRYMRTGNVPMPVFSETLHSETLQMQVPCCAKSPT